MNEIPVVEVAIIAKYCKCTHEDDQLCRVVDAPGERRGAYQALDEAVDEVLVPVVPHHACTSICTISMITRLDRTLLISCLISSASAR